MLPPKRERFCREYVIDLNGTRAAIRAGYSKKTADVQAAQLLANIKVSTRVAELQAKVEKKLEIKVEDVLKVLMNIINVDPSTLYHPDGSPRLIHDIPEDTRKAISIIDGKKKYSMNLADRMRAVDMLMKHLGGTYGIQDQADKESGKAKAKETTVVNVSWTERPVDQSFYDKPGKE